MNQIELHPWFQQRETLEYCKAHGIVVTAYCPLARCKKLVDASDPEAVKSSIVAQVAEKYGKTQAQICIRWVLQMGAVCIPKSSNPDRIKQNADVFSWKISDEDMDLLATCDETFYASNASKAMLDDWDSVK